LGTHEVAQGELSVGGLTTFLASAYYFYGALSSFTNWYLSLLTGLVSADKVFKVLRIQPAVLPPIKGVTPCPFEKGIVLRDVSLRYPSEEKEALKGINLCIAKGETIALVGPSGSGKSSLIKLFLRLYDPTKGTILLDAHKLSNIDLAALRGLFGVAPQDPGIFQDSVEAAVTYGRPRASKEEVSEAVRMAGAHEFISNLPQGYQTLIGERAVKLSGGEKQRLALARALLRNPEILILDEALSSVDGSTEKAILQSISSNRRGRTNILISHRLMSIVHADRIVVMDRGAIIEEGNHKELLAASTKYREWFFIQQSEVSA
jgi:ABC-type multidrug transport system fused ATPase/permease subunit